MKQALKHTAGLPATFTGSNDSMPFGELLNVLAASAANGVLLAQDDERAAELRFAAGALVSDNGIDEVASLIASERAAWSFRATAGAPSGQKQRTVEQVLLAVLMNG